MLKNLSQTSIYQHADAMKEANISEKVAKLLSNEHGTIVLTKENMEDVFYKIRHKAFQHAAKTAILDLFARGTIELIYNEEHRVPAAVPFFKKKVAGGYAVVINISNFSKMQDEGDIVMDPSVLYVLMVSGALSLVIDKHIESILPGVPELYGGLFSNVIARMNNLDLMKKESMKFIGTKFFYMMVGIDEKRASEKAAKSAAHHIDEHMLLQIDLSLPVDAYNGLDTLLEAIKKVYPEFKGFEFGVFFDRWLRSYGELSAFAIEYVPYFYTVLAALMINCNTLINIKTIEKEATRHDKNLVVTFSRIEQLVVNMAKH